MSDSTTTEDFEEESAAGAAAPQRTKIEILGLFFEIAPVYSEGHVLTQAEAVALDTTRRENIRNTFSKQVKKALEEVGGKAEDLSQEKLIELGEKFEALASSYTFTKTTIRSALDPVEKEARNIANTMALAALQAQNISKSQLQPGVFEEFLDNILAESPHIYEEARARLEAAKSLAINLTLPGGQNG